ncbi:LacI family DNA-binding transcriptional regulator [Klebsiella pneumoniae]|nr:LacI family DNA-binding transcriptional regulator [Klebsiella pneumoniae]
MAQNISWYGMIAPEESQFRVVNVKPVTLYDVAEYAGVSYQTVSRVVNQPATSLRKRGKRWKRRWRS